VCEEGCVKGVLKLRTRRQQRQGRTHRQPLSVQLHLHQEGLVGVAPAARELGGVRGALGGGDDTAGR